MSLNEFDQTTLEKQRREYAEEARRRWGGTEAYRESERRTSAYGEKDWETVKEESDKILRAFAALVGHSPVSAEVRAVLKQWQDHISARFYPCTDEILAGLGEMYTADERFAKTLDAFGAGTAQLMSDAIRRRNEAFPR